MPDEQDLQFNVIFVPGTVEALRLFTISLMDHSRCRYRLVANGCSRHEVELLAALADSSPRIELLVLDTPRPLLHGTVLTQLQREETSSTFAFMDSDIFAVGPFLDDILPQLDSGDAVFSCPPVWSTPELEVLPERYGVISGVHNHLHDGTCIGSSYFAIYRNEVITSTFETFGIDFRVYNRDEIPAAARQELFRTGRDKILFDTGKLLNLLISQTRSECRFVRTPLLCHAGGISARRVRRDAVSRIRTAISSVIPEPVKRAVRSRFRQPAWYDVADPIEVENARARLQRRAETCRHITEHVNAIVRGRNTTREFSCPDNQLFQKVREFTQLVEKLYEMHGARLSSGSHEQRLRLTAETAIDAAARALSPDFQTV